MRTLYVCRQTTVRKITFETTLYYLIIYYETIGPQKR